MSTTTSYPAGVPCWVDTFQPNPEAATQFYGPLLGWTFDDPIAMPDGLSGEYRLARSSGHVVAGIGQAPTASPSAVWTTYITVDDVDTTTNQAKAAGGGQIVGPTSHGEEGRLAVLTDPVGIAFGIWQPGSRHGAERVNAPGAWTLSSLHTPTQAASKVFYGQLFGWTLEPVPSAPMAFWRLTGHVGGKADQLMPRDVVAVLAAIGKDDPTPPHWSVALTVADVDATARLASELGGAVLLSPTDTPGFRSAVIADTQGGVVAITAQSTTP